jgi:hypothetical protein
MAFFNIKKKQDRYYLSNTEVIPISYTVNKLSDCTNFLPIYIGTVSPLGEVEIILPTDGEYQIVVTNSFLEEATIPIKNYNNLLLSTIQSIFEVLCPCDCGCSGCSDIDVDGCHALLTTKAKLDAFKRLVNPLYVVHFDVVYAETKCLISKQIYCCIAEEDIRGACTFNDKLIKQFIALDYLAIFFYELAYASTEKEIAFVRAKFKSEEILCCISKLGIDIQKIKTLIDEGQSTITIISTSYINLPPDVVGDNSITVDNRSTTILTLPLFTSTTTPPYHDPENDPVDALRVDSLPVSGTLYLNGVPVTLGQVIAVSGILSNFFTYESPNIDASDINKFNFSLRDTGSLTWSS